MATDDEGARSERRLVTSEELSRRAVVTCWAFAVVLLATGISATLLDRGGAGAATLVLFGGVLVVLALMKRVPLRFEVGGAKLDASYETDRAFDAGREGGLVEGLETAIDEVAKAERAGETPGAILEELRAALESEFPDDAIGRAGPAVQLQFEDSADGRGLLFEDRNELSDPPGRWGYRIPAVCSVAAITYRQLDYWTRTGLVRPRGRARQGTERLYTLPDIVLLKMIKRLLDAGISLQQIRAVVGRLHSTRLQGWQGLTLMSDGTSVYLTTTPDEVIDLLAQGRGLFGISMATVITEAASALAELPGQPLAEEQ